MKNTLNLEHKYQVITHLLDQYENNDIDTPSEIDEETPIESVEAEEPNTQTQWVLERKSNLEKLMN